jgi:hypothetical protein
MSQIQEVVFDKQKDNCHELSKDARNWCETRPNYASNCHSDLITTNTAARLSALCAVVDMHKEHDVPPLPFRAASCPPSPL